MLAAWFKDLTKTHFVLVTYRGGANVLSDLMGGQIDLAVETNSILLPHLRDGTLRALETPSPKRLAELSDVPTMAKSGVPGFIASFWTGIVAPPGTPEPIVAKLNAAVNTGLSSPATQTKLKTPKWIGMAKLSGANAD
jgi:tripartite-type tricarboxylate transporter receptor subunit TctC